MRGTGKRVAGRAFLYLSLSIVLAASVAGCSSSGGASVRTTAGTSPASSAGIVDGTPGASPGGGGEDALYPADAVYVQSGETKAESGRTYTASEDDQSAILVSGGGTFMATSATIETTGNTSNDGASSMYGLNAAVVATAGSAILLTDCSITTTGSGANGAFAPGEGAAVTLANVTIEAAGDGGHGVMATLGGSVTLNNAGIVTAGAESAPLATGRGGGKIVATGGSAFASGRDSPALYSTGVINVDGGRYEATGAEAAVIEGASSITLTGTDLSSAVADRWGVMIYQGVSGNTEGIHGAFTMASGSLSATGAGSPLFYVTNATGIIDLSEVEVDCASGILVRAAAGSWGRSGANGGNASLNVRLERLTGDFIADHLSSIRLSLDSWSLLDGAINTGNTAKRIDLSIGAGSVWIVTADSYLTTLTLPAGVPGTTITNIFGNGHTVYYDASDPANNALGGLTYRLAGGGTLTPVYS